MMLRVLLLAAAFIGVAFAALDLGDLHLDLRRQREETPQQQQQPDCDSASYQKSSLTLLSSKKFAAMYLRSAHMRQFEASGVSIGPSGQVAVVFDNSHALGLLDSPLSESGELAGERGRSQSGWEGVAWRDDDGRKAATVLALREAVEVVVAAPFSPSSEPSFSWAPPGFVSSGNSSSKDKKKKPRRKAESSSSSLFAVIDELSLPSIAGESPKLLRSCPVDFPLTHENKGLEDLYYLSKNRALALCEGNFCSGGSKGREKGNGRILVLSFDDGDGRGEEVLVGGERAEAAAATARARRSGSSSGPIAVVSPSRPSSSSSSATALPLFAAPCAWRVDAVLDLPPDASFEDYSGLAVRGGLAAVLSQQDEATFVAGFDVSSLKFDPVPSDSRYARRVFALPRSQTCERAFCTAEGIDLVDDPLVRGVVRVLITTDKAAAGSPWNCIKTAEAVHVMSLPKHALPQAPEEGEEEESGEEEGEEEGEGEEDE